MKMAKKVLSIQARHMETLIPGFFSQFKALCRSHGEVPVRSYKVFLRSLAVEMERTKAKLRHCTSLVCLLLVPPHRLHVALSHAMAFIKFDPEVELRRCIFLLCRLSVQRHRSHVAMSHTSALIIKCTQAGLRQSKSLVCHLSPPPHRAHVALSCALAVTIHTPRVVLCISRSLVRCFCPRTNHLFHLLLIFGFKSTPSRFAVLYISLKHKVQPHRLLKKLLWLRRQFCAVHGAKLLHPKPPQPLHASRVKYVPAYQRKTHSQA